MMSGMFVAAAVSGGQVQSSDRLALRHVRACIGHVACMAAAHWTLP